MKYIKAAKQIIKELGGEKNIESLTHCMTRLRFVIKDESIIDDKIVKAIPGVIGVVKKGGQYQVIIGNDVAVCYEEILKITNISSSSNEVLREKTKGKITVKGALNSILDTVAGSMAPIMPTIIACGMIKLIIIILDLLNVSKTLPTYRILTVIGDTGFYFLPVLLAYSAAKKFKCSPVLAVTVVSVLIHPELIKILTEGNSSFLRIPIKSASYGSTVIPALLSVWFLSKLEPIVDRYCQGWKKTIFKPTLILLICIPISLAALAPLGLMIGNGMAVVLTFMQTKAGWLTLGVYSALLPLVVMTGMHYALFPYIFSNLSTLGYDILQLPAMLAYNLSQAATCAAVALRTKDKDLKAVATTAAISAATAGISEPALYGVSLRLKKPLIASMIGSGAAGVLIGFVNLKAFTFASPSLMAIPMYASAGYMQNFIYACIAAAISIVVTFVMTLILGWDEPVNDNDELEIENVSNNKKDIQIESPLKLENQ